MLTWKKEHYMATTIDVLACPSPERVNILLIFAVWFWYAILRTLRIYKVDVTTIVQVKPSYDMKQLPAHTQLERNAKQFAISLSKWAIPFHVFILLVFALWNTDDKLGWAGHIIIHTLPLFLLVLIIASIVRNCEIIRYAVKRLPLIEPVPNQMRNVYILLSDSLTSFNRPLIDFTFFTSLLFSEPLTHFDLFLSSIPSLIRIFQCLREYKLVGARSHLGNAFKYSCNLPILVCTWYSRANPDIVFAKQFQMIQIFCLLLNSTYSFFWDIKMDWSLSSFVRLRPKRIVFERYIYHVAIAVNFVIRYWWIWILFQKGAKNSVLFDEELQYLEVFRRAQWVVFKLESEYVNSPQWDKA
ncbi:Erd1p KNAG_0C04430 [Huiozyma naganishii CBS 8797]|uniref:EXS domain-containing protein n=1 Tax=Huiozyma naganishii (strain ATCC MYA-139 / BCRC 22969 / CBS 8797 / KCTC 17520 / NBRC 10181 / NCYC 3082 / Yp74L-3) TaxID=1071383 RepID=J7R3Y8_HUIN7|nr:hypothetical protein KNAG_0C04430 [Kazachstania naganishii CBS 8797]CCK69545.1 hypothetical protein KNAG_0C04430 [Kazachstania naganishii CBS 8797]